MSSAVSARGSRETRREGFSHPRQLSFGALCPKQGEVLEIEIYFSVFSETSQAMLIWFKSQSYLGEDGGRDVGGELNLVPVAVQLVLVSPWSD